jgi:hypothetical protein
MKNKCERNISQIDLLYDELVYLLQGAISKKYGIWCDNVPITVLNYVKRKAELLPNGVR